MSCVMSRPSSPPRDRMKEARDFLYWLNHCSWYHTHTHTPSTQTSSDFPAAWVIFLFLQYNRKWCHTHLLCTHVEADIGGQHAAVFPAQRSDPQQAVVPAGEEKSSAIMDKQARVTWCTGEQVLTGRRWRSAGSSAGSSDVVWWRESAQLDLRPSPRYWETEIKNIKTVDEHLEKMLKVEKTENKVLPATRSGLLGSSALAWFSSVMSVC